MRVTWFRTLFAAIALFAGLSLPGCGNSTVDQAAIDAVEAEAGEDGSVETSAINSLADATYASDLAKPFRMKAGGEYIDTDVGHAAPYLADLDGDGLKELLVGQFGEGKLKVCQNIGSDILPEYDSPTWFMAAGDVAKVPAG